jgi:hypothetical protein
VTCLVSQARGSGGTGTHEVTHRFLRDLIESPDPKDVDTVVKAVKAATGKEFTPEQIKKSFDSDVENNPHPEILKAEETLATLNEVDGYRKLVRDTYGTKRERLKAWFEEVKRKYSVDTDECAGRRTC